MNKHIRISIIVLIAVLMMSMNAFGDNFKEPNKPDTNKTFDPGKEKKMDEIASLDIEDAFEELKSDEYLSNPDLAYKAIYKAFNSRKLEILDFTQLYLMYQLSGGPRGEKEMRDKDFLLSKRIFETFPEDAAKMLRTMYDNGDEVTRGNTVRASGKVADGHMTKKLLIEALDDASYYEALEPDDMGEPMRVCDMAYNQLVLRYSIRNVHRTIGPGISPEVRDQLIYKLKDVIK